MGSRPGGEADWWATVYRRNHGRLLAYARRRVRSAEAADAVAEVFLRAYERRDRLYGFGDGVDGWLFGVLRNVTLEMRRAGGRARHRWLEGTPVDDPADRLIRADEAARLRTAFARLGRADQQILRLRYVDGLTTDQLARHLGKRPGAVRMAQSRALARLRSALAAQW